MSSLPPELAAKISRSITDMPKLRRQDIMRREKRKREIEEALRKRAAEKQLPDKKAPVVISGDNIIVEDESPKRVIIAGPLGRTPIGSQSGVESDEDEEEPKSAVASLQFDRSTRRLSVQFTDPPHIEEDGPAPSAPDTSPPNPSTVSKKRRREPPLQSSPLDHRQRSNPFAITEPVFKKLRTYKSKGQKKNPYSKKRPRCLPVGELALGSQRLSSNVQNNVQHKTSLEPSPFETLPRPKLQLAHYPYSDGYQGVEARPTGRVMRIPKQKGQKGNLAKAISQMGALTLCTDPPHTAKKDEASPELVRNFQQLSPSRSHSLDDFEETIVAEAPALVQADQEQEARRLERSGRGRSETVDVEVAQQLSMVSIRRSLYDSEEEDSGSSKAGDDEGSSNANESDFEHSSDTEEEDPQSPETQDEEIEQDLNEQDDADKQFNPMEQDNIQQNSPVEQDEPIEEDEHELELEQDETDQEGMEDPHAINSDADGDALMAEHHATYDNGDMELTKAHPENSGSEDKTADMSRQLEGSDIEKKIREALPEPGSGIGSVVLNAAASPVFSRARSLSIIARQALGFDKQLPSTQLSESVVAMQHSNNNEQMELGQTQNVHGFDTENLHEEDAEPSVPFSQQSFAPEESYFARASHELSQSNRRSNPIRSRTMPARKLTASLQQLTKPFRVPSQVSNLPSSSPRREIPETQQVSFREEDQPTNSELESFYLNLR